MGIGEEGEESMDRDKGTGEGDELSGCQERRNPEKDSIATYGSGVSIQEEAPRRMGNEGGGVM